MEWQQAVFMRVSQGSAVAHVTPCQSVRLGGGHKIGHSRAHQLSEPTSPQEGTIGEGQRVPPFR